MAQTTYKGFPITYTSYHQPKESDLGIQEHYIIEDVLMCGIDPYDLLGDDGMEELFEFINKELMEG